MDITPLDVQYEDVQEEGGAAPDVVVTGSSPVASGPRVLGRDSPDRGAVVPVDTDLPVQCTGYLLKQGRKFRGWHQRWFEIQGQHMYYYKTNAKSQCLGEIELSICTQVQPTRAATFGVSFEIQTTERSHILAARTSDDMQKWIQCIKSNMGPREGTKSTKTTKMKKWDSFRNAFAIRPRSQASPEPAESIRKADVSRNKSFFGRFKRRNRSKSPVAAYTKDSDVPGGEVHVALRRSERGESPRPLSVRSEDMPVSHLYPPDLPVAVSLPSTPLTAKREGHETAQNISHSPSSSSVKTPGSNLSSAVSSPEHLPKFDSSPVHTSTPSPKQESSPGSKEAAVKSSPPKPKPPPRTKRSTTKLKQQTSTSSILSNIVEERLAWDEIKEMLESLPEKKEELSYDELPSEDETWLEKDTPIEQLREFLAVCA